MKRFILIALALSGCTVEVIGRDECVPMRLELSPEIEQSAEIAAQVLAAATVWQAHLPDGWSQAGDTVRVELVARLERDAVPKRGVYDGANWAIYLSSQEPDLFNVALHEIGHALSAKHHDGPGTMSPEPGGFVNQADLDTLDQCWKRPGS